MSELLNQVQNISSLTFEDARNVAAYTGMAIGIGVPTGLAALDYFRNPRTDVEGQPGDIEGVEAIASQNDGRLKARIKRWGPYMLMGLGVSVASVQLMDPQIEYTTTVPGVEAMHVVDESYSMELTKDMTSSLTRLGAVDSAISESAISVPEDMKMGVVSFGANVELITPLTTDETAIQTGLALDVIDGNGGQMSEAIELADSVLVGSSNSGGETLFIHSDGTVDDPNTVNQQIRAIAEDGRQVVIVIPGTENGSYTRTEFDSNPTPSGIDTVFVEGLEDLDNVQILQTSNSAELQPFIEQHISEETQTTEKQPTNLFLAFAAVPFVAGLAGLIRREWKRK